jgi:hypothetical protein
MFIVVPLLGGAGVCHGPVKHGAACDARPWGRDERGQHDRGKPSQGHPQRHDFPRVSDGGLTCSHTSPYPGCAPSGEAGAGDALRIGGWNFSDTEFATGRTGRFHRRCLKRSGAPWTSTRQGCVHLSGECLPLTVHEAWKTSTSGPHKCVLPNEWFGAWGVARNLLSVPYWGHPNRWAAHPSTGEWHLACSARPKCWAERRRRPRWASPHRGPDPPAGVSQGAGWCGGAPLSAGGPDAIRPGWQLPDRCLCTQRLADREAGHGSYADLRRVRDSRARAGDDRRDEGSRRRGDGHMSADGDLAPRQRGRRAGRAVHRRHCHRYADSGGRGMAAVMIGAAAGSPRVAPAGGSRVDTG